MWVYPDDSVGYTDPINISQAHFLRSGKLDVDHYCVYVDFGDGQARTEGRLVNRSHVLSVLGAPNVGANTEVHEWAHAVIDTIMNAVASGLTVYRLSVRR